MTNPTSQPFPLKNGTMKPLLALRVHWPHIKDENRLAATASFLRQNCEGIHEIIFFTENIHGYLPVSNFKEKIPMIGAALETARKLGFRAGVNILNTVGHFDECPSLLPRMDVPPMVGLDGETARTTACPYGQQFLDATAMRYRLVAELHPDVIWIDDDTRLHHHTPVNWGCFCDGCIVKINTQCHTKYSRADLKELLKKDEWPGTNEVRGRILEWRSDGLNEMCRTIERAVHEVSPKTEMGLMMVWSPFNGAGLGRWLNTLRGPDLVPVHYRPGGGFYNDDWPTRMIDKAVTLPPDTSDQPVQIETIQCELENFPYCPIDKPPRVTMVENTCHLAAGCTGILLNLLGDSAGPLDEYAPFFSEMRLWMPFWEKAANLMGDMPLAGLWEGVHPYGEASAVSGDKWPEGQHHRLLTSKMMQFGIPMALWRENSSAAILTGTNLTTLKRDEIEEVLSKGAIVDGDALGWLWRAGLGELTGVKVERTWKQGVMEQYADHPWNDGSIGSFRDARGGFFHRNDDTMDYTLSPVDESVVPLGYLVSQDEEQRYGMSSAIYENKLGGRVVSLGYRPWDFFRRQAKHKQYSHIARWVSRETLPLWIKTYSNLTPFVRQAKPGGPLVAMILNPSDQPREDIRIGLAHEHKLCTIRFPFKDDLEVNQTPKAAGSGWEITISRLGSWDWALIRCNPVDRHREGQVIS